MAIGGVLLAAGEARRMGGRPKALLRRDGSSLLRRNCLALLGAGVAPLVVVLGHRASDLSPHLADLPVEIVHAVDYAQGKHASVRRGLAALPAGLDGLVVALADQPALEVADIQGLIDHWREHGGRLPVVPRVGGQRGNPVILPDRARVEVLAASPGFGCRDWLDQQEELVWFETDQAGYILDVDTELDMERLQATRGITLSWPEDIRDA